MRRIIIIFYVILISSYWNYCSAQNATIDSLRIVLNNSKEDTSKVNTLNALSRQYDQTGNYNSALEQGNKALTLARELKFKNGEAAACVSLGWVYQDKSDFGEALKDYLLSKKLYEELGDKKQIAFAYLNVGNILHEQGNYPDALKNYYVALKISEDLRNQNQIGTICYNIGMVYAHQGNYPEALKNYNTTLSLYEKLNNNSGIANCYMAIGAIYNEEGNYSEALKNYYASLKQGVDKNTVAFAYTNIGEAYSHLGNYEEALNNYGLAVDITKEIGDKNGIAKCYTYLALLNIKTGKNIEARKYLDDALQLSKKLGSKVRLKEVYNILSLLDSATGNWKDAYQNHKMFMLYRDSLINEENTKKTVQASMQYEFDKKEAIAKEQQDEKDVRQNLIRNSIIAGLILVLVFALVVYRQRNKIAKGKKRSDHLLLNILPAETAEELKATGKAKAKKYEEVTVLFTDFKGFTEQSEKFSAEDLVNEINGCYSAFDNILLTYGIEKIKTIGDSYMCASGLPQQKKTHASDMVKAALEMQQYMQTLKEERQKSHKFSFEMRIGINSGPVVAGIVGITKFAYDIWGDTVNIASRMEAGGSEGKVNISGGTYAIIKNEFECQHRGKVSIKGKGEVDMYFVEGPLKN